MDPARPATPYFSSSRTELPTLRRILLRSTIRNRLRAHCRLGRRDIDVTVHSISRDTRKQQQQLQRTFSSIGTVDARMPLSLFFHSRYYDVYVSRYRSEPSIADKRALRLPSRIASHKGKEGKDSEALRAEGSYSLIGAQFVRGFLLRRSNAPSATSLTSVTCRRRSRRS